MNNNRLLFAIGTNSHRQRNMNHAQNELEKIFGDNMRITHIIETEPIGIGGPMFLNCLAECFTVLSLPDVKAQMKRIELECGNTKEKRQRGIVEMDIDILEYAGELHHINDWQRPYIMKLFGELQQKEVSSSLPKNQKKRKVSNDY
jgi:2-amino-4-hydroxy-6-hydroxymethyldihydropteridine diphosphokinase